MYGFLHTGQTLSSISGQPLESQIPTIPPTESEQATQSPELSIIAVPVEVEFIPSYVMCRKIENVKEAWIEYTVGWNGGPSVKALEDQFQRKWRKTNTETKFFCRRAVLFKAIESKIEAGLPLHLILETFEQKRVELKSLSKLCMFCKSNELSF
jgi:hypothetical protein